MAAKKLQLVTLDQAVDFIKKAYGQTEVIVYSKKTLRNMILKKELTRYGPKHMVFLDVEEIKTRCCPHE